jgi:hypothetical protein
MSSNYALILVWPLIISLPLLLTHNNLYSAVFPSSYFVTEPTDYWSNSDGIWPSPCGLTLGIMAVVIGQLFTLLYFIVWRNGSLGSLETIQKEGAPKYVVLDGLLSHLAQPEGFVMLGGYLILSWMFGLMPSTYYSFSGGINWFHVIAQLLVQDFIQYLMHILEHNLHKTFYQLSHKPHHRFTNPKLFDAFNGSITDTLVMILIPLIFTARLVPANVWSYMTFGTIYANWLCLIHSEYKHSWDFAFQIFGLGTPADHHVHHKLFKYNFGHLFM